MTNKAAFVTDNKSSGYDPIGNLEMQMDIEARPRAIPSALERVPIHNGG